MNFEEELRGVAAMDQSAAAIKNMAELIAVFWNTLVAQGIPHDSATELTRPLLIKVLGGSPE